MEKDYVCANCGKEYEVDLCFCNKCMKPKIVSKKALANMIGIDVKDVMNIFKEEE